MTVYLQLCLTKCLEMKCFTQFHEYRVTFSKLICFSASSSLTLSISIAYLMLSYIVSTFKISLDSQKSHSGTYSPAVMNSSVDLDKSARSFQEDSFNASDITLDSQDDQYENFTEESNPQDMEVVLFRGLPYQLINCIRLISLGLKQFAAIIILFIGFSIWYISMARSKG